ncbi:MAG: hypothetical protein M0R74_10980 [Dehalococcoidia bacterium]|jgi:hypothetical protein|nr:hypothetical protein [Dehalococcoidia bacterium]
MELYGPSNSKWDKIVKEKDEEIEALRERVAELAGALKKIRDYTEDTDFPFRAIPRERMIEIAREALAGKGTFLQNWVLLTREQWDVVIKERQRLKELEEELNGYMAWERSINEALNTGDGASRP